MTSKAKPQTGETPEATRTRPFRRFVLRGLGVVMPPLLTLVLFIWAWATVDSYILKPTELGIGEIVVFISMRSGVLDGIPNDVAPDQVWVLDANNQRVPTEAMMNWAGAVESIPTRARTKGWCQSARIAVRRRIVVRFQSDCGKRRITQLGERSVREYV